MRWTAIAAALALGACSSSAAPPAAEPPPASAPPATTAVSASAVFEDWYPDDIAPPEGTSYPCALTALPRALPGVGEADRRYVNHVYTLVLRATQSKLRVLRALERREGMAEAQQRYDGEMADLTARLDGETVPDGLASFQADVRSAFDLQRAFFAEAARVREAGREMTDVFAIRSGRQASARLISAWGAMQRRYPAWTAEMRESVYHHLCALDLF